MLLTLKKYLFDQIYISDFFHLAYVVKLIIFALCTNYCGVLNALQ